RTSTTRSWRWPSGSGSPGSGGWRRPPRGLRGRRGRGRPRNWPPSSGDWPARRERGGGGRDHRTGAETGTTAGPPGGLSPGGLRGAVGAGTIDTVVLAFTDMQGRLQGKRISAEFFLDEVVSQHAEGCNYLLAVDIDMNTVDGYEMSSWERGYGDFVLVPDLGTLRHLPWHEASPLMRADVAGSEGSPVVASPRQILKAQADRLAARGWTAVAGTELEFCVFRDSYEDAQARAYRDLTPVNLYNVDYSILGTGRV